MGKRSSKMVEEYTKKELYLAILFAKISSFDYFVLYFKNSYSNNVGTISLL